MREIIKLNLLSKLKIKINKQNCKTLWIEVEIHWDYGEILCVHNKEKIKKITLLVEGIFNV